MTSRRGVLGVVPAILAGCVDTRSGGTERPPTGGGPDEPPTDGETGATPTECDQPTPEPTPNLSVGNRRSTTVTVTVTVTRDGTATVFEETVTVEPGAYEDRFDVFPTEATYLVRAELDDGSTASETLDVTPGDRRSLVAVTIADGVDVGILNVVPGPTPVPCG